MRLNDEYTWHGISPSDLPIRDAHEQETSSYFADIAMGSRTSGMDGVSVVRDRERLSGWKYRSVVES